MEITYDKDRKTWTARWRVTDPLTGKKTYKKKRGFPTKRDARDFLDLNNDTKNSRFCDILDDYLSSREGYVSEDTLITKKRMAEMYCYDLMPMDVTKINKKILNAWKSKVTKLDLSVTTKNKIIRVARSVSYYGNVNYNLPDFAKTMTSLPKKGSDKKPMQIMSVEDFDKAMSCCDSPLYRAFFIFLYHTGVRRGEARAILKTDIEGNRVSITKSLRREKEGFGSLKNYSSNRVIVMDKYVMEAIEPLMDEEGDFLFGGLIPLPLQSITNHFRRACKKARVKEVRIHDLRHSFISNALANGANVIAVAEYAGHKNPNTTLSVYAHAMKDAKKELIDNMEKLYDAPKMHPQK